MANVHRLNMGDRRPNEEPLLPHFDPDEAYYLQEISGPMVDPRTETFWQFLRSNFFFRFRTFFPLGLFIVLCVASFVAQLWIDGLNRRTINILDEASFLQIDFMGPYTGKLTNNAHFVRQAEVYRLLSSNFVHADLAHLLINTLGTAGIGSFIGIFVTPLRLFVLILGSGVAGNLFALNWYQDDIYSFGFSTCVCGCIGILTGFLIFNWKNMANSAYLRMFMTLQTIIFVSMVLFGTTRILDPARNGKIGHSAHFGGLLSGIFLAMAACGVYQRSSTPTQIQLKHMYRVRITGAVLSGLFVAGSAFFVLRGK